MGYSPSALRFTFLEFVDVFASGHLHEKRPPCCLITHPENGNVYHVCHSTGVTQIVQDVSKFNAKRDSKVLADLTRELFAQRKSGTIALVPALSNARRLNPVR